MVVMIATRVAGSTSSCHQRYNLTRIKITFSAMPAPPPGSFGYGHQGPSCFDKMKMGFMIGFCVGMASGALFGGFSALR